MAADPIHGGITYDKDHLVLSELPGLGIQDIEGWTPF